MSLIFTVLSGKGTVKNQSSPAWISQRACSNQASPGAYPSQKGYLGQVCISVQLDHLTCSSSATAAVLHLDMKFYRVAWHDKQCYHDSTKRVNNATAASAYAQRKILLHTVCSCPHCDIEPERNSQAAVNYLNTLRSQNSEPCIVYSGTQPFVYPSDAPDCWK